MVVFVMKDREINRPRRTAPKTVRPDSGIITAAQYEAEVEARQAMIRQQQRELTNLELELDQAQSENDILQKMGHFPTHFAAGVIRYPDRRPFGFVYRHELKESDGSAFATTALARASASWKLDSFNPFFITGLSFAQYRTQGTAPLGVYLPLCGFRNDGNGVLISGLNFKYKITSSIGDRKWQQDWRDSMDFERESGFFSWPIQQELYREEQITVEVEPLVSAGDDLYKMFVSLHGYKMYEIYADRNQ